MLKEIFERDVTKIINRAAIIASDEDAFLFEHLDGTYPATDRETTISTTRLRALPIALRRRAIHGWLKLNHIPKISFEKIEECLTLLDPENGPAKINLPGDHHARRKNKTLFIE